VGTDGGVLIYPSQSRKVILEWGKKTCEKKKKEKKNSNQRNKLISNNTKKRITSKAVQITCQYSVYFQRNCKKKKKT
jgi:hypothetical protein